LLVVLAAGLVAAGYLGLRDHAASQALARDNAEAVEAAKHCVLATQAPDGTDVALAQQTILDCAAGEFRTQAGLYAEIFVQAYRAAKVHTELTEMGAAVERNNDDGSVDVLVAFRIKVDNVEAQGKEVGYRLRAQMVREDGQFRIGRLDQVAR
jgi:Mce-associated membrane protein